MPEAPGKSALPEPILVACRQARPEELLAREWLVANKIGAYASSTVIGTNTRRYHGLLGAALRPPVGRIVTLSCLMDQLILPDAAGADQTFDLTTFEFAGTVSGAVPTNHGSALRSGVLSPDGRSWLMEFRNDVSPAYVYRCGEAELVKEIVLAESANAVAVRYRLTAGKSARLRIWPFLAMRDYHALRRGRQPHQMTYLHYHDGIRVEDRLVAPGAMHISVAFGAAGGSAKARRAQFHGNPQWWYRFLYRADIARGQEGLEDLYNPGWFGAELKPGSAVQLTASLDDPAEVNVDATVDQKRRRLVRIVRALGPGADESARRLAVAGDAFVVSRSRPNAHPGTSIVAGYHWFADWGRDAMIALPGLLLAAGRHESALQVLRTFAGALDEGMIPNCFDEYGGAPHFNSIDASLWFIIAADAYVAASGDEAAWRNELAGPVDRILSAYRDGTRFGIRADADGLLAGGDENTQLTWMDVTLAGAPVTPRYGKCVEINALWHAALRIAGRRSGQTQQADSYTDLAGRAAAAFRASFWNEQTGCLYDHVVDDREKDASIRPNQIFAVALPDCPLSPPQQRRVVEVVRRELLTPYGLRTLSPNDPRYRGRYGGSWESRDRAYHQGTAWPWLMGPFLEAYLKVNEFSPLARSQAGQWLRPLDEHLSQAGIGFISEVFDGDPPHAPAGCIAQAWSVAEILRVKRLIGESSPTS